MDILVIFYLSNHKMQVMWLAMLKFIETGHIGNCSVRMILDSHPTIRETKTQQENEFSLSQNELTSSRVLHTFYLALQNHW